MTIDRVAGLALVLIGLVAIEESRVFPFGTLHRPGPAFMPMLLAALLIVFGAVVFAMGARARRLVEVGWPEWRHAVAIFAACAFAAGAHRGPRAWAVLVVSLGWAAYVALPYIGSWGPVMLVLLACGLALHRAGRA